MNSMREARNYFFITVSVAVGIFILLTALIYFFYMRVGSDFLVYSQAIEGIRWGDLNPLITLRGYHIFNDHFDPILIPVAFLGKLFDPFAWSLSLDFIFVFLSVLFIYRCSSKGEFSYGSLIVFSIYTFYSSSVVSAIASATHPTTWSILFITTLCYAFYKKKDKTVLLLLVLLFSCKEENIYVGVMLGGVYLYYRKVRYALWVFLITGIWAFFVYEGRFWLWNYPSMHYSSDVLNRIKNDPFSLLKAFYTPATLYRHVFVFFLVFLTLWIRRQRGNLSFTKIHWVPLILMLPIYAIRVLSGGWKSSDHFFSYHYAISISSFVGMFFLLNLPDLSFSKRRFWIFWLFVLLSNVPTRAIDVVSGWSRGKEQLSDNLVHSDQALDKGAMNLGERFRDEVLNYRSEMRQSIAAASKQPMMNVYGMDYLVIRLLGKHRLYHKDMWRMAHDEKLYEEKAKDWENQTWRWQVWTNPRAIDQTSHDEMLFVDKKMKVYLDEGAMETFRKEGEILFEGKRIFLAKRHLK